MNWKFWDKDDPLKDLSNDFNPSESSSIGQEPMPDPTANAGLPPTTGSDPFSTPQPQQSNFNNMYNPENSPSGVGWEPQEGNKSSNNDSNLKYDVIIARLDAMKTLLESVNQRLVSLEEQKKTKERGPWYTK